MMAFLKEWVLHPQYLPSWLSAVTAIIALGISVFSVLWANAATRRRNRLELRGLVVAVYPEILMLKDSTQHVRDGITEMKRRFASLAGQSLSASLMMIAQIPLPPMIERNIDKLFLLGYVAGPSCLHLVRLISQYNATVDRLAAHMATLAPQQWMDAVDHLDDHLALLDRVIAKCDSEVRSMHDSIKE